MLSTGHGMGAAALSSLWNPNLIGSAGAASGLPGFPNFPPKAKRAIYLFFPGGPSHIDLFDYKPELRKIHGQELPDSIGTGTNNWNDEWSESHFLVLLPCLNLRKEFGMELG